MLLLVPTRAAKLLARQANHRATRLQSEIKKTDSDNNGSLADSDSDDHEVRN